MKTIRTQKNISIDFNSNEVRIVEGKFSKKGILINNYFSISIPYGIYQDGIIKDIEQLGYIMRNGLLANGISLSKAHAVIDSSEIVLREVLFPQVDVKDIENLIKYQLGDYIPIKPEDYIVKYINLGNQSDNGVEKLNLLLIGVPINMVESHFRLLKNIGLKPMVLDYKGNSICKLLSLNSSITDPQYMDKSIAFLDLNYENIGLSIFKDRNIIVSRIIEHNLSKFISEFKDKFDFTYDFIFKRLYSIDDLDTDVSTDINDYNLKEGFKKIINDIMDNVEMIFRYYRTREIGNDIDLILLHGDMAKIEGIEKIFSNFFNVPCSKLKSLNKLKFDGDLTLYANAIGGLIRLDKVRA